MTGDNDVMVLAGVLVLAACMTLVIGIARSSLPVVYVAIATSVLAGIALAVSVARRRSLGGKISVPVAEGSPRLPP